MPSGPPIEKALETAPPSVLVSIVAGPGQIRRTTGSGPGTSAGSGRASDPAGCAGWW
ncbi:hypothetical protein [Flindersiella endophytica]